MAAGEGGAERQRRFERPGGALASSPTGGPIWPALRQDQAWVMAVTADADNACRKECSLANGLFCDVAR